MKRNVTGCILTIVVQSLFTSVCAQQRTFEVLAGNNHIYYQHAIGGKVSDKSRWGWLHLASVLSRYEKNTGKFSLGDELMNQGYLTFALNRRLSVLAGAKYTNATNFAGSVAFQYVAVSKNSVFVVLPRIDVTKNGAFELFSLYEVRPKLNDNLNLYIRLQGMTNHGPYYHNRGYQQLRVGIQKRSTQVGIGINLDQYGKAAATYVNAGVFIRKHVL